MSASTRPSASTSCCARPRCGATWTRTMSNKSENASRSLFTSPLAGEVDQQRGSAVEREGGDRRTSAQASTPLPNPPPQGGREHAEQAASGGGPKQKKRDK